MIVTPCRSKGFSLLLPMLLLPLLLLVGCNDLASPVDSVQQSFADTNESITIKRDKSGNPIGDISLEPQALAEGLRATISEDSRSVVLQWEHKPKTNFTLIRSENAECDPVSGTNCQSLMRIPNLSDGSYVDDATQQGAVYYYWLVSQQSQIITAQSQGDNTQPASRQVTGQSEAQRVILPILDDLDNLIAEQPPANHPQDVVLTQTQLGVSVSWGYTSQYRASVYASSQPDCRLTPSIEAMSNRGSVEGCATLVGEGVAPPLLINDLDLQQKPYIWIVMSNPVTALQLNTQSHRLIGPYKLAPFSQVTNHNVIELAEYTRTDKHAVSLRFSPHTSFASTGVSYTLVAISSFDDIDFTDLQQAVAEAQTNGLSKAKDINAYLSRFGTVQTKILQGNNFVSEGRALSYSIDVDPDSWYTFVLSVSNDLGLRTNYLPQSIRTASRVSIDVQGEYGVWRVLNHNEEVEIALRSSGYFYPGILDWRTMSLDAQMAIPEQQSYFFVNCPYYTNAKGVLDVTQLSDNQCLLSAPDTEDVSQETLVTSPYITVVFESKAKNEACQSFTPIHNTEYQRNRDTATDNYQPLLCDYLEITPGSDTDPQYFGFVNPNNAPASIARGNVEMWHAGTQAPVFITSSSPQPNLPDATTQATVCSKFGIDNKECDWSETAHIVRCNGYFVYQLPEPPGCSMSYAVENNKVQ